MLKKTFLTILSFLSVLPVYAHSKTEIGHLFYVEDQKNYLEVHLTSSTIFDLLYELHPELRSRESLNLSHFASDYESYFNQNIDLNLNGKAQQLKYVESNLIVHDASLVFLIEDFTEEIVSYNITLSGFGFYQKPSFPVLFATPLISDSYLLSKQVNSCSGPVENVKQSSLKLQSLPEWLILMIPLGLFVVWFFRIRKT